MRIGFLADDPTGILDYMADIDFINYSETHLIGFQLTTD